MNSHCPYPILKVLRKELEGLKTQQVERGHQASTAREIAESILVSRRASYMDGSLASLSSILHSNSATCCKPTSPARRLCQARCSENPGTEMGGVNVIRPAPDGTQCEGSIATLFVPRSNSGTKPNAGNRASLWPSVGRALRSLSGRQAGIAASTFATSILTFEALAASGDAVSPGSVPSFLDGHFRPVDKETTAFGLPVRGAIPSALSGRYFRNGHNPKDGINPGAWFYGSGMIHGLRISGGRAEWYRNRWVKTPALGGAPLFIDHETIDLHASAAGTSVIAHAGRILALRTYALASASSSTIS